MCPGTSETVSISSSSSDQVTPYRKALDSRLLADAYRFATVPLNGHSLRDPFDIDTFKLIFPLLVSYLFLPVCLISLYGNPFM